MTRKTNSEAPRIDWKLQYQNANLVVKQYIIVCLLEDIPRSQRITEVTLKWLYTDPQCGRTSAPILQYSYFTPSLLFVSFSFPSPFFAYSFIEKDQIVYVSCSAQFHVCNSLLMLRQFSTPMLRSVMFWLTPISSLSRLKTGKPFSSICISTERHLGGQNTSTVDIPMNENCYT